MRFRHFIFKVLRSVDFFLEFEEEAVLVVFPEGFFRGVSGTDSFEGGVSGCDTTFLVDLLVLSVFM